MLLPIDSLIRETNNYKLDTSVLQEDLLKGSLESVCLLQAGLKHDTNIQVDTIQIFFRLFQSQQSACLTSYLKLVVQQLQIHLPMQGVQVPSLFREIRS